VAISRNLEPRWQARFGEGGWRGYNVTADNTGVAVVLDGQDPDDGYLEFGEAVIFNRSTTQNAAFGPTQALAVPALAAAAAGGVNDDDNFITVPIGVGGSLWLKCPVLGSSAACIVFVR